MQQDEGDCVMCDISTHDRNRTLTEKGKEYMKETLKHHRACPPSFEAATPASPLSLRPMPVKSEVKVEVSPNPLNLASSELPDVKMECQSLEQKTVGPGPSEVALQEIAKLQAKQTELSVFITEQQQISFLPIQEPPIFNGNYFDYPIFMRAVETIIEARVSSDKERLYFLNKYTTGKANELTKGFVTLNSNDSYKQAKNLLAQRFRDPHHVSNVYKSRLKSWPQIGVGQSTDLQAFSDFLGQCVEAMKSMKFLSDLGLYRSTEASQFQAPLIFTSEVVPPCL